MNEFTISLTYGTPFPRAKPILREHRGNDPFLLLLLFLEIYAMWKEFLSRGKTSGFYWLTKI